MHRFLHRDVIAVAAGLVAPLAVAAVLVPARTHISNTDVALVLVVVVVAVAADGHRLAGVLAALSAAVWFDFFFTQPYERFTITKSADIRTAVLLLLVGLAVSQLAARARRLQVIAITDARYLSQIHDTAELARSTTSPSQVVDKVKQQLTELLTLRGCRFEYGSLLGHPARLEADGTVIVGHKPWNVDERGLPDEEVELRAFGNGHYYGRFMLQPMPGAKPPLQARLVSVTLADQVGAALDTAVTGQGE
ncbi:PAS domain-containing sensor histidine kinase [Streptomyces sp. RB6PN25]|uniref:PAS domain-containing sensor histidine kinase n=1 Tax=Streptomyces humicola TaxID=2953240 RepID=A0ABT1PU78_9ACTN|nr:DUF4118 domain-containing protein [Streptomyces humicola]MCQ4081228.1 PAS domain-containing sensor histidine kinase [Streptomyces humicola]